jgi:hypothetical protein
MNVIKKWIMNNIQEWIMTVIKEWILDEKLLLKNE